MRRSAFAAVLALAACASCAAIADLGDERQLADPSSDADGSAALPDGAGDTAPSDASARADVDEPGDADSGRIQGDGVVIASGQNRPWGIAVNGAFVFWTNRGSSPTGGDGALVQYVRTSGQISVSAPKQATPDQVLLDTNAVFWAAIDNPLVQDNGVAQTVLQLGRIALGDPNNTILTIDDDTKVSKMRRMALYNGAVDDGVFFVIANDKLRRYLRTSSSGAKDLVSLGNGVAPGTAVAVDANLVYYAANGTVYRRAKADAPMTIDTLAVIGSAVADLQIVGNDLWALTAGGDIYVLDATVTGQTPTKLASVPGGIAHALVVKDTLAFVSHGSPGGVDGEIVSVDKNGGTKKILAAGLPDPHDLAIDPTEPATVFWTNTGDGTVRKTAALP